MSIFDVLGPAGIAIIGSQPVPVVVPALTVNNQSLNFGDLTDAGDGKYTLIKTGSTITAAVISSGDASGHWTIDNNGDLSPSAAGDTANLNLGPYTLACSYNSGEDTATHTVTILADTYTVLADATELDDAIADIGTASSGARTVKMRDGTLTTTGSTFTGEAFVNVVTVEAENAPTGGPPLTTWNVIFDMQLVVSNMDKVTFSGIHFKKLGLANSFTYVVFVTAASTDIIFDRCEFSGDVRDINGDYSASGAYVNGTGLGTVHGASCTSNLTVQRCYFHDLNWAMIGRVKGNCFVKYNEFKDLYGDVCQFQDDDGNGGADIHAGNLEYEFNFAHGMLGIPKDYGGVGQGDASDPHTDFFQVLKQETGQWTGIKCNFNILNPRSDDYRGRNIQGCFMNTSATGDFEDVEVKGNVFLISDGLHGISIYRIKNGEIINNTVCQDDPPVDQNDFAATIFLGGTASSGTINVWGNAADALTLSGSGTYVQTNANVTLGKAGATIAYSTAFDGTAYGPDTRALVLSEYNMKDLGPCDDDNSSSGTVGDAGAVGSGYVTWGDIRDTTGGWAHDAAYEPGGADVTAPILSSNVVTKTDRDAKLDINTDEANGTLYWMIDGNASRTAAQVKTGGGSDSGNQAVSSTGAQAQIGSTDDLNDNTLQYFHAMHEDAATNQSTVVTTSFTTDTDSTAPILSSPSVAKTDTTADLTITTDESTGTNYWMVDGNASRTAAQVKTGGGTDSGNQVVTISGVQGDFNATGLTASTLQYFHAMHEDEATNQSTVSTTSFTTNSSGYTPQYLDYDGATDSCLEMSGGFGAAAGDSKQFFISCWVSFDQESTDYVLHMGPASNRVRLVRIGTNINLRFRNAAGTVIYERNVAIGSGAVAKFHYVASGDLNVAASDRIYIDGVDDAGTAATFTNDTIEWSNTTANFICARNASADLFNGQLGDLIVDNTYLDLDVAGNLDNVISGGNPVDPGSDGSDALGGSPVPFIAILGNAALTTGGTSGVNAGSGSDPDVPVGYTSGITDVTF